MNKSLDEITTTGYMVFNSGDPEVGIQPLMYNIDGEHYFESEKQKKTFEQNLVRLYEYITGEDMQIMSYEEFNMMEGGEDEEITI